MNISLPIQLPDELFFSRIVRFVVLTGVNTAGIQRQLFHQDRACIHPSLTPFVNAYCESLDSCYQQTLGPLFQLGLPESSPSIKSIMGSNDSLALSRFWKLPNQKGLQIQALKSCAQCFFEDTKEYGLAYWHRAHQIPNVSACHKHGINLDKQTLTYRYHLAVGLPSPPVAITKAAKNDVEYAQFCANLISDPDFYTKESLLLFIFRRLDALGFMTKSNRIRRQRICDTLFLKARRLNYEQEYFVPDSTYDFKFIRSLLSPVCFSHPGRFCIFLYWLSQQVAVEEALILPLHGAIPLRDDIEEQCISLLHLGHSLNETAKMINKSRTYVKSLALKHGITNRLRPKRINMSMRQKIIKMAQSGWHRRVIANQFLISDGSVELIISSRAELVIRRKRCKFESIRRRYRVEIRRFVDKTPNIIRQDVFENCNAAAHWLLRHDKGWLFENIPSPLKPMIRNL